ncbi:Hypothetical protein, putative [Bodo saltans]|uniref:Uncharacterized protein n=1 Tax=Bodo saltans TaxID=75058 RepID=A0A0S4IZL9_BODSA|nr:Hypothetical protein, putative [Bodo saltans]|eukprot:CUG34391.1 Hypothetical protein, putative [Bodo saltans]
MFAPLTSLTSRCYLPSLASQTCGNSCCGKDGSHLRREKLREIHRVRSNPKR